MGFFKKTKTPLPAVNSKVGSLVQNDKLVVIVGAESTEIEPLIARFCKLYNRNDYKVTIKLHPIEERIMALSFPEDIDFVVFFYLIKSLNSSYNEQSVKVVGWCTIPPIELTNPGSKQSMIYMDPAKSIYLTTQDNSCWKINFDKSRYETSSLVQAFTRPPYTFLEVKHREGSIIE